uniref:Transposase n=1 Tax=Candidatus Kentrum sp. LFY TaxID=2126342 RepID=A0A450ULD7_9GAMM|nr:MAG: hypothetical protein BECKLFY1418B_GA0070995_10452 [Candidatus Kentron sp. LFY]
MYLIVIARKGISSLQLSKELDITRKSAWCLMNRIRKACEEGDRLLQKVVEVDETYVGGKDRRIDTVAKSCASPGVVLSVNRPLSESGKTRHGYRRGLPCSGYDAGNTVFYGGR